MNGNPAPFFRVPALAALALMLANDALGGPVRYALAQIGLVGLSYAPFLVAAAVVATYALAQLWCLRLDAIALGIFLLSAIWLPYSLLLGLPPSQVAFGFYTWMPFFLAMVGIGTGGWNAAKQMLAVVWAVAILGVAVNAGVRFPWVGESYEILGVQADFAREWQAFGVERLPGFSRASFTAANQIAVGACLLLAGPRAVGRKLAIWLVSIGAIWLTTSKAPLLALLIVPLGLALLDRVPRGKRLAASQAVIACLLALAIGLPLAALLGFRLVETGNFSFLSFGSIDARMDEMWPRAYALLDPVWPRLVLGVSFGGIGAGQVYFDPARFSPGDNLFVFLYATFGLGSLLFLAAFWRGNALLFRLSPVVHRDVFVVAMLVLVIGAMSNVVESVVPALLLGVLAAKAVDPLAMVGGVVPKPLRRRTDVRLVMPVRI